MIKHKFIVDTDPEVLQEHKEYFTKLVSENPWLIPATISLEIIPVSLMIHGFWKNRQLKKQVQIEKERTKQFQLERHSGCRPNGKPRPLATHLHHNQY